MNPSEREQMQAYMDRAPDVIACYDREEGTFQLTEELAAFLEVRGPGADMQMLGACLNMLDMRLRDHAKSLAPTDEKLMLAGMLGKGDVEVLESAVQAWQLFNDGDFDELYGLCLSDQVMMPTIIAGIALLLHEMSPLSSN